MKDERDEVVEKVLVALGRAEVPEGLEARVAEGLARRAGAVRGVEFRWREVFARSAVAGVWWRGVVVGVAASLLVVGGVMLAGHFVRGSGVREERVAREVAPVVVPARGGVVGVALPEARREPCANQNQIARRVEGGAGPWRGEMTRVEKIAPPRAYVALPLTAQEKALVHIVQTGDAKELAMLNPEVQEKQEAEETAQFQRFFAEPAKPVAADASAAAAPVAETVVGGPGLAVSAGEASVAEPDAAKSSTDTGPVSGGNQ